MARFEKQITDEQIATARAKIAAGKTLRAAADEIPCAPSTLSYRIQRAKQAEAAAVEPSTGQAREGSTVLPEGVAEVAVERIGPLEVLRAALQATKADGQPDWGTRISAARTLGTLRPQELAPKEPKEIPAQITLYDLEPGAHPVLHQPRFGETEATTGDEDERTSSNAAAPDEEPPLSSPCYYHYQAPEGGLSLIGSWQPAHPEIPTNPQAVTSVSLAITKDPDTAERWRAELTAGRLPQSTDNS